MSDIYELRTIFASNIFRTLFFHYKHGKLILLHGFTKKQQKTHEGTAICVFHTHVANQIPENLKYKLVETIENFGKEKDIFHIYNNMWDRKLHLDYFIDGVEYSKTIGNTDGHGKWFEWNI